MQWLAAGKADLSWELLTQLAEQLPDHRLAEAARLELFCRAASVEASLHWPPPQQNRAKLTSGEIPLDATPETVDLTSLPASAAPMNAATGLSTTQHAIAETTSGIEQALQWAERIRERQPDLFFEPRLRFPLAAVLHRAGQQREAERLWRMQGNAGIRSVWRSCAAREIAWLQHAPGDQDTQPTWICRAVLEPPYLDGQLDDAAWKEIPAVQLRSGSTPSHPLPSTEVRLAHDQQFLYLAVRCERSPSAPQPDGKATRQRDTDLSESDRVIWYVDVDHDYATRWQLTVDERGWANDRLNQDPTWDPEWYIATQSDEQSWTVESAVRLEALTPDRKLVGSAWRCAARD